jgi:hypothetical protein
MSVDAHRFVGGDATISDMPLASNDVRGNRRGIEILAGRFVSDQVVATRKASPLVGG